MAWRVCFARLLLVVRPTVDNCLAPQIARNVEELWKVQKGSQKTESFQPAPEGSRGSKGFIYFLRLLTLYSVLASSEVSTGGYGRHGWRGGNSCSFVRFLLRLMRGGAFRGQLFPEALGQTGVT